MTETEQEVTRRDQCAQCAAPLAADQRYCVNCGARRSQALDPAARYFSEACAARARVAAATRARAGANRKGPKHLRIPATLLAVIVLASAAAGFEIGSSSGGTTTTSTTSTKSAVTSTAKTNSSTGTSTSSATGKNYSKQENKDNSVVSEP
jgi:hypothetical protein